MKSQKITALLLAVMMLILSGNVWSAQAGRVQFVYGNVELTTENGASHAVHKGDPVSEGDTLVSAKTASAQIKMQDGGFIAVRPDTQLKFDSFKFGGKAGEPERSIFSLIKGGFRAVTGLVGRVHKEDYLVHTKSATIGIRGTDHEIAMVLPDNPLVATGQALPGVYNKVNLGETIITTDMGSINVLPNQMGYAGGMNQMPSILPINSELFTVAPKASPGAKISSTKGGDQGAQTMTDKSAAPQSVAPAAISVAPVASPTVVPILQVSSTAILPFSPGIYRGVDGISSPNPFPSGALYTLDTTGLILMDCSSAASVCYGGIGTATNMEVGGVVGVIEWGRWSNGVITAGGTLNGSYWGPNQGLAYILGMPTLVMPVTGAYTFNLIGGTSPTVSDGIGGGLGLGHLISGSADVNFASSSITNGNLRMGFNGSSIYNATYSGPISSLSGTTGLTGSTTLQSGSINVCGTGCSTMVQGKIFGSNANYLGIGYQITTNSNFNINGVAAYKR